MTLLESTGSRKPLYIGLILLLFATNGFLLWKNSNANNEVSSLTVAKAQIEEEKMNLQLEYNETVRQFEDMKIENAEQDSTIVNLTSRVEEQKSELSRLFKKNKLSSAELNEVKSRLYSLRLDAENYLRTITALQEENQALTAQNVTLSTDLEVEKEARTELEAVKTDLETQTASLSETNDMLSGVVEKGSILAAENIKGTAVRFRNNGKEIETTRAKRAEKLKICFDALPNNITEPGNQEILVRLMSPEGSPISVSALGSGTFTEAESGEEKNFTTKADISYRGKRGNYCIYWQQTQGYGEGLYAAELFHRSALIGSTSFNLN